MKESALEPGLPDLSKAIAQRAREIYEQSGRIPGRDVENWCQAEAQIRREYEQSRSRAGAIKVRVNGLEYIGEYSAASAGGYKPGEFAAADPVPVRFEGDKMYVRRPNGKELETRIVRKSEKIG
jgi:Protein of unknown function (DUF2934)